MSLDQSRNQYQIEHLRQHVYHPWKFCEGGLVVSEISLLQAIVKKERMKERKKRKESNRGKDVCEERHNISLPAEAWRANYCRYSLKEVDSIKWLREWRNVTKWQSLLNWPGLEVQWEWSMQRSAVDWPCPGSGSTRTSPRAAAAARSWSESVVVVAVGVTSSRRHRSRDRHDADHVTLRLDSRAHVQ